MNRKSVYFGMILGLLHLFLGIATLNVKNGDGLEWLWVMVLELPVWILSELVAKDLKAMYFVVIAGTAYWFLIGFLLHRWIERKSKSKNSLSSFLVSALAVLVVIALNVVCIPVYTAFSMKSKRPAELKALIGKEVGTAFQKQSEFFETKDSSNILSVDKLNCQRGEEIVASTNWNAYFLDSNLHLRNEVNFSGQYLNALQWIQKKENECFLVGGHTRLYFFDEKGKILWSFPEDPKALISIDAVRAFVDSNDSSRAIYVVLTQSYFGLHVLNDSGKQKCFIPETSIGQVQTYYSPKNKRQEIIYSKTFEQDTVEFKIVDQSCQPLRSFQIKTQSTEFNLLNEDEKSEPSLILTDENAITRISNEGQLIQSFAAPGSRTYGHLRAQYILRDSKKYLAVRKELSPDLTAFWVFDSDGKIQFEKVDIYDVLPKAAFLGLPSGPLLYGEKKRLLKY